MVNRGNKLLLSTFNRACATPGVACDLEGAGDGFLFREGYAILWSGWQGDVVPVNGPPERNVVETVRVPVARNADGSAITGPIVVRWSDLTAGANTLSLRNAGFYSINALGLGAYLPAALDTRERAAGDARGRDDDR